MRGYRARRSVFERLIRDFSVETILCHAVAVSFDFRRAVSVSGDQHSSIDREN